MPVVSGKLYFDKDRSSTINAGDSGIANVSIVLQDINSLRRITSTTDSNGDYSFINVLNGSYRIVEAYGEVGGSNPTDFNSAVVGLVPVEEDPPIGFATNPPAGATNLDSTTPNTIFITVNNTDENDKDFLDGPIMYTPIESILDSCAVISSTNLITEASNGTFGSESAGSLPNTGPATEPYPGIAPGFNYVPPSQPVVDGDYTVVNILYPPPLYDWWILADHTVGDETGRFQAINGANPGGAFFEQIVNVSQNTNYLFSTWIANLDNVLGLVEPALGVEILDMDNNILYKQTLGNSIPINPIVPQWKEIGTILNSQENLQLKVRFISEGPSSIVGNDYAIDDVKLRPIIIPEFVPVKSANLSIAHIGEEVTYTVTLTNTCTSSLTSVFFKDVLPPELKFVQGSVTGGNNPNTDDPNLGFYIPDIQGNTTATITFKAIVESIPSQNPINNIATMNYEYTPVQGGIKNSFSKDSNIVPLEIKSAELDIVKSVDKSEAVVGNTLTYTIDITNIGNVDADNVSIVDVIPNGTSYVQNSITATVSFTGNPTTSINLTNPITPKEKIEIIFKVKIDSLPDPNPIVNVANAKYKYVSNPNQSPVDGSNNSNGAITNVGDVVGRKKVDKGYADLGDELVYTITLDNPGTAVVNNVLFKDQLPIGVSYNDSLSVSTAYTGTTPMGGLTILTINPGETVTISWNVIVEEVKNIENYGTVTIPGQPSTDTNKVTTNINHVDFTAPGSIEKSVDKSYVDIGDEISYTITVRNLGNVKANNVVVTDSVPNGTSYIVGSLNASVPITGLPDTGITIVNGILPEEKVTINYKVRVDIIPIPNPIPNKANISATYTVNPENPNGASTTGESNTVYTDVRHGEINSDNAIKTANTDTTTPGDVITYTVTLKNTGNVEVNNVLVKDLVPTGSKFIEGTVTINGNLEPNEDPNIGINIGNIDMGKSVIIEFRVIVLEDAPKTLVNKATIDYSYRVDPDKPPINNRVDTNTVNINVLKASILLVKSENKNNAVVGDVIRYSIVVTNNGEVSLNNVIIKDELESNLMYDDNLTVDNISNPGDITVGVNIGSLVIGHSKTIAFDVKVVSVPESGVISNVSLSDYKYTISGKTFSGSNTSNKINLRVYTPEISLSKTANKSVVKIGDIFNYNIKVTNTGDIEVNNIIVKDSIAAEFDVVQIKLDGMIISGDINLGIDIGDLTPGESKLLELTLKVLQPTNGTVYNVAVSNGKATINNGQPPVNVTANGNDNIGVSVYNPQISLEKSVNRTYVTQGDIVTYKIVVTNTGDVVIGNVDVAGLEIYDLLSNELQFINGSIKVDGISKPNDTILSGIDIGSLNIGESMIITFEAEVISDKSKVIENIAKSKYRFILPGSTVPQDGSSESNRVDIIPQKVNVDVNKDSNKEFAVLGDKIIYTVTLTNTGNLEAENVIFRDTLPIEVTLVEGSFKVNGVVINSVNLEQGVNIGNIGIGQRIIIQYTVEIISSNCLMKIENVARIKYNYQLPDGIMGSKENSSNKVITNLGINNFNQISIEEYLDMPDLKPDIEVINSVSADIVINKCKVIQTIIASSYEGQNETGYKLIVLGILNINVEYTAIDDEQTVHSAGYKIPFSSYIVLPYNYELGTNMYAEGIVEDIYYKKLNDRCVFTNTTLLVNAKIVKCS